MPTVPSMACEVREHMKNVRRGVLLMTKDEKVFSISSQHLIHYCNKNLIGASECYEAYYVYIKYSLAASSHRTCKKVPVCICAFIFNKL